MLLIYKNQQLNTSNICTYSTNKQFTAKIEKDRGPMFDVADANVENRCYAHWERGCCALISS